MTIGTRPVARILYKELTKGDLKKIKAQSNTTQSGGGARDFRFGRYPALKLAIQKMFPQTVQEKRTRGGKRVEIDVFKGVFCWLDDAGKVQKKDSFFEPPTDARGSEGRLARVHEYDCFDTSLIPTGGPNNKVLLLLIQLDDDSVWPRFAEETSLRSGGWDTRVADALLACIDAKRPANHSVVGFWDFLSSASYCNGK